MPSSSPEPALLQFGMDVQAAQEYLKHSLEALAIYREQFFREAGEPVSASYSLDLELERLGETKFLLTAWWRDAAYPNASSFWDYLLLNILVDTDAAIEAQFKEILASDARLANRVSILGAAYEEVPDEVLEPLGSCPAPWPLYKYHPLRFRKMSSMKKLIEDIVKSQPDTFYQNEIIADLLPLQQDLVNYGPAPMRDKRCCINPRDLTYGMLHVMLAAGDHAVRSNAIYEFPAELIDRFKHTDIGEVPLSEIRLPYEALYVHFGPQAEYEIWPGWYLDGAYVGQTPNGWNLVFTAAAPSLEAYHRACLSGEPSEHLNLATNKELKLSAGQAIEQIIAELAERYRSEVEGTARDELGRRSAEVLNQQVASHGKGLVNAQARNARIQLERLPHSRRIWDGALKILLNALMYLTVYPEDSDSVWSAGTPKHVLNKLREGSRHEREKARTKLATAGHTRIILTGRRLREQLKGAPRATTSSKEATYVSGHWRRFAVGPGRQERRWQWLLPYIRNANAESPPRGHIYLIDPDPTLQ